jgi:hypothetical protein
VSLPGILVVRYLHKLMSRHIAWENRKVKTPAVLPDPKQNKWYGLQQVGLRKRKVVGLVNYLENKVNIAIPKNCLFTGCAVTGIKMKTAQEAGCLKATLPIGTIRIFPQLFITCPDTVVWDL